MWYLQQLLRLEAEERQVEVQIYSGVVFVFLGRQHDVQRAQGERLQDTRVLSDTRANSRHRMKEPKV